MGGCDTIAARMCLVGSHSIGVCPRRMRCGYMVEACIRGVRRGYSVRSHRGAGGECARMGCSGPGHAVRGYERPRAAELAESARSRDTTAAERAMRPGGRPSERRSKGAAAESSTTQRTASPAINRGIPKPGVEPRVMVRAIVIIRPPAVAEHVANEDPKPGHRDIDPRVEVRPVAPIATVEGAVRIPSHIDIVIPARGDADVDWILGMEARGEGIPFRAEVVGVAQISALRHVQHRRSAVVDEVHRPVRRSAKLHRVQIVMVKRNDDRLPHRVVKLVPAFVERGTGDDHFLIRRDFRPVENAIAFDIPQGDRRRRH